MHGKEDRQRAQEANFARTEEDKFIKSARVAKQLGLWAAEQVGKSGEDAEAFANDVRSRGVGNGQTVMLDYVIANVSGSVSETAVRQKFAELNM